MVSKNIVGMDFGTTNSTVSVFKNGEPELFMLPGSGHYVPSVVAYDEDGEFEIGIHALESALNDPDSYELYRYFKIFLPMRNLGEIKNHGWPGDRLPEDVTKDYLFKLLLDKNYQLSFIANKGNIEKFVLTVPEVWQKNPSNLGAVKLKQIVKSLGLPLVQLLSEPVAAAAYYTWKERQKDRKFEGVLLVCDVGGGTFDVSLVNATLDKIEVIYHEGNGTDRLGKAGVAYDTEVVRRLLSSNAPNFDEALYRFESQKINNFTNPKQIERFLKRLKSNLTDLPLFNFKVGDQTYKVNAQILLDSFRPIQDGLYKVLNKIKSYLTKENIEIDRLVIVGGFGRFVLVRDAIREFFQFRENDPRYVKGHVTYEDSYYAISYGASLVAEGAIEISEKYRHTVGLKVFDIKKKKHRAIKLIKAGTPIDKLQSPVFFVGENGEQFVFQFIQDSGPTIQATFLIWIDGKGEPIERKIKLDVKGISFNAKYRLGMKVDNSNILWVIFEDKNGWRIEQNIGTLIEPIILTE